MPRFTYKLKAEIPSTEFGLSRRGYLDYKGPPFPTAVPYDRLEHEQEGLKNAERNPRLVIVTIAREGYMMPDKEAKALGTQLQQASELHS